MMTDNGGVEQTIALRQLNCGMGIFTILDAADGWIPVEPAVWIRIEQEQQAVLPIEQEHAGDLTLDHGWLLHRVDVVAPSGLKGSPRGPVR